MNDNELYAKQFKIAVVGLVALFAAGVGSCQSTQYQKRMAVIAAIEAGAKPLAASCTVAVGAVGCQAIALAEAEAIRADATN